MLTRNRYGTSFIGLLMDLQKGETLEFRYRTLNGVHKKTIKCVKDIKIAEKDL